MKIALIPSAAMAVGVAIALTALIAAPRFAVAKPEFAQQTGKACGFCHQNPGGGGKLKPAGEKFKKNGKL